MVSLGTIVTLGLLAVGAVGFIGLGGAAGIGQRIGGGFKTFSESITAGLFGGVFNPNSDGSGDRLPEPTCGLGTRENSLGQCVPIGETTPRHSFARFDISNLFSSRNIQARLQRAENPAFFGSGGTPFGGFPSARVQEGNQPIPTQQ